MDWNQLSRTISHALRHDPESYGLTLDEAGWVEVRSLLDALRRKKHAWKYLREEDLLAMSDRASKKRYEFCDGKVRAFYGHSTPQKIRKETAAPPERLYHGTSPDAAAAICREGLKPMGRQYVHLSEDVETARVVGRRKAKEPVVLAIAAARADREGVRFYRESNGVWLADAIPPEFLGFLS